LDRVDIRWLFGRAADVELAYMDAHDEMAIGID